MVMLVPPGSTSYAGPGDGVGWFSAFRTDLPNLARGERWTVCATDSVVWTFAGLEFGLTCAERAGGARGGVSAREKGNGARDQRGRVDRSRSRRADATER